jgi:hypothetical protein
MGYDLYGLSPSNEQVPDCDFSDEKTTKAYFAWQRNTKGAYFRQNIWGWRPVWRYVMENCGDIISVEDAQRGSYNDGHEITKEKAKLIANRINSLNKSGDLVSYARTYATEMDSLPDEECKICNGTGTRKEWEGWQSEKLWLMHHDSLNENGDGIGGYSWAKKCNGCNSCHGLGKVKDFDRSYPFEVESMLEFAEFCEYSGGFRIC